MTVQGIQGRHHVSARFREITGIVLLAAGMVLVGYGLFFPARAALTEILLQRAFGAARADEIAPRPWPWAAIRPVAGLEISRHAVSLIIVDGENNGALRLGPRHVRGTAQPGRYGHSVVIGNASQFSFLQHIRIGELIDIERPGGARKPYIVVEKKIVDLRKNRIRIEPEGDTLSLVGPYPPSGTPDRSRRFVVTAIADRP
ncbi:MAG: sortase [Rhodospirillales bacterium]